MTNSHWLSFHLFGQSNNFKRFIKQSEWQVEDWQRVIFSDEKTFSSQRTGSKRVRKLRNEPSPAFTWKSPRRITVNCWGCITKNGVGKIVRVSDGFNGEQYEEVLKNVLPETMQNLPNCVFQQDNASIHKVESVTRLFNTLQISTLSWPAKSPDPNIIEHVWALMQVRLNKLYDEQGEPKNVNQLFSQIEKVWNEITVEEILNLYKSLPKRVQCVIAANGNRTKY